jgi:outer membrane protein
VTGVSILAPVQRWWPLILALGLVASPKALAQDPPAADLDRYASPADVSRLLEALGGHPGLRAAEALAEAAALRLDAVRQPLALSARYDARRLTIEEAEQPLPGFELDTWSESVSLSLILRPFLAGDLADLGDQRRADAERAALQARESRTQLEAQALEAAQGLWLADFGVRLAEEGEALARAALAATERRAEVGGANVVEVGEAQRTLREATASLRDARVQRDLAAARLASLVGTAAPLAPPALDPVVGVPPDLLRAVLDVALAEVGARSAMRSQWPTVEAGYTWLLDDGGVVRLGVESRTWQPALSYQSETPDAPGTDALADLPAVHRPTLRGSLDVGVAWTFSPQTALEAEATARQLDAAVAGLASAHERARLTRLSLDAALANAADRRDVAELDLQLRALERDAADDRFASGAIGELERLQAQLAWQRAAVALARARADLTGTILDTYVAYAIPPSEVLP